MSVIAHFVMRQHRRQAGYVDYDDEDPTFIVFVVGLFILAVIVLLSVMVVDSQYHFESSYQVDGTVVGYGSTSGKHKKVTVWLKQYDDIREYSTNISNGNCVRAPIGTHVPVVVVTEVNEWTGSKRKSVSLVYNPCKGVR